MVYPNENRETYNDRKMKQFVRRAPTEKNEIRYNEEEQVYRVSDGKGSTKAITN